MCCLDALFCPRAHLLLLNLDELNETNNLVPDMRKCKVALRNPKVNIHGPYSEPLAVQPESPVLIVCYSMVY